MLPDKAILLKFGRDKHCIMDIYEEKIPQNGRRALINKEIIKV